MRLPTRPANIETPGLKWRRRARKGDWSAYWICRADISDAGFSPKTVLLHRGGEPSADEWRALSIECARLQGAMLTWRLSRRRHDAASIYDGSWRSLIDVYTSDPISPFQKLRARTRQSYLSRCNTLTKAIGDHMVEATTLREILIWYDGFRAGGKVTKAYMLMVQIRLIVSFGKALRLAGVRDVQEILDEQRFENPKRRKSFVTAAQCIAIRAEAHRRGFPSIALAQALQFELGVRQKDAVGEWIDLRLPGLSDIHDAGEKWLMGFRWDEVDAAMILRHRLSKSVRGAAAVAQQDAGELAEFPLTAYPMVMEELARIPIDRRVGAMVVAEHTGLPWRQKYFAEKWREIARAAGVPDGIQNRDSRAGSITEGRKAGASIEDLRHHAGHSKTQTTAIYDRQDVADRTKVAQLRAGHRGNRTD